MKNAGLTKTTKPGLSNGFNRFLTVYTFYRELYYSIINLCVNKNRCVALITTAKLKQGVKFNNEKQANRGIDQNGGNSRALRRVMLRFRVYELRAYPISDSRDFIDFGYL